MVEEFLIAIGSQLVATLVAAFVQRRFAARPSILEVKPHSEVIIVHKTVVRFGPFAFERSQQETRIIGVTFRRPPAPKLASDLRLPLLAGLGVFVAVLLILLVL